MMSPNPRRSASFLPVPATCCLLLALALGPALPLRAQTPAPPPDRPAASAVEPGNTVQAAEPGAQAEGPAQPAAPQATPPQDAAAPATAKPAAGDGQTAAPAATGPAAMPEPRLPGEPMQERPRAARPGAAAARPVSTAAAAEPPPEKLSFGTDYRTFEKVTGYVNSTAHGNRLGMVYVSPAEAAEVYRHNADLLRSGLRKGFRTFPVGAVVVMETWRKVPGDVVGPRGPVFLMKKEAPGYDPITGDWRYAFAEADLRLIGEGGSRRVAFCGECHAAARERDHVPIRAPADPP